MRKLVPFALTVALSLIAFAAAAVYLEGRLVHSHFPTPSPQPQKERGIAGQPDATVKPSRKAADRPGDAGTQSQDDVIRAGIHLITGGGSSN